jgi:hypothetical protein
MTLGKPLRMIPRWLFVVAAIVAAPFVLWLGFGLSNRVQSLRWHWIHGDKVLFGGHTITLPSMWRQRPWANDNVLRLDRAVIWQPLLPLLVEPEDMTIASENGAPDHSGFEESKVVDDAAALRWQTKMVSSYHVQGSYASPEVLRGRTMTFYCFNRDDGPIHGACFICTAVGTDWEIIFSAGQTQPDAINKQMQEAKEILKSIQ